MTRVRSIAGMCPDVELELLLAGQPLATYLAYDGQIDVVVIVVFDVVSSETACRFVMLVANGAVEFD